MAVIAGRGGNQLSLAIPSSVETYDPASGSGKMWHRTTRSLRDMGVKLKFLEPAARRFFGKGPDVWLTNGHMGALGVDAPVVAHLQEAPWLLPDPDQFLDPTFVEVCMRQSEAAAREAALVLTPSEHSRQQVISTHRLPPSMVRSVPLGVDAGMFHPGRQEEARPLLESAGCPGPYVLFVSTVHPRKNLGSLRTAMWHLAERGIPHHLVLVLSPAADRADSTELAEAAVADLPGHPGRVHALRNISEDEVASLMAGADALCAPSWSEGFGFAPLEAMACGTPVVVSNRGSLPEVVGDAGLVVDPDAEAIANGLELVLTDREQSKLLSKAGIERSRLFSWRATAAGWLEALEEVTGR